MANNHKNRLQHLSKSNYEIVDGEPNIRDWDVKDEEGKRIGEVEDLLFDEESRKVRYIIVDLEDNEFDLDDKEVLVPIGIAQLHESDDDVILPGVTAEQLRALPEYDEDSFDNETEVAVRNVFAGAGGAALGAGASRDAQFYQHEHFDENKLYRNRRNTQEGNSGETIPVVNEELQVGKQEIETGGVRLRSRIVEEEVSKDINLREETVKVERNAVNRTAEESDLREEEVEMREFGEVPVVNKEARVVEEISLNKEVTERDETINDTVRNTEVDIDRDDEASRKDRDERSL